mmetsp:Transcript_9269/g.30611  ORF Transcript_9269/g.30611 Transcript_9269/m.30611 type:complete len:226 (+) Transcript_9269:20-697(+)
MMTSSVAARVTTPLNSRAQRTRSSSLRTAGAARCEAGGEQERPKAKASGRRDLVLSSTTLPLLGAMFHFSGDAPRNIGVRKVGGVETLALCPRTPNCIATSEELNDPAHYVPPLEYNPADGRGLKKPATQAQAMEELVSVVQGTSPDGFTPTIIKKTDDYLYVEYESPLMGFVDDVEFWFPSKDKSIMEYRSASRLGESDGDINRKRIKAIRVELQKKGWRSVGF